MATLFRTGDGSSSDTIVIALELVNPDWFRRNLIHALELMCQPENWTQNGTADVDFARDKANEMLENMLIDVKIPVIPVGTIQMFGDSVPPALWLPCDGRAVGRADYADLFAVIGTQYGVGNGSTTFNVPNMVDKIPMSFGGAVVPNIGNTAGALTHTLTPTEMPTHNHALTDPGHAHTLTDPGHNHTKTVRGSGTAGGTANHVNAPTQTTLSSNWATDANVTGITVDSHTTGITLANAGSGGAHSILNPVVAVNFIIYSGV